MQLAVLAEEGDQCPVLRIQTDVGLELFGYELIQVRDIHSDFSLRKGTCVILHII